MATTPGADLIHTFTAGWHDDKYLPLNEEDREKLGLHLAGEYLFLIACTEGAWKTGKEAAQEIIDK